MDGLKIAVGCYGSYGAGYLFDEWVALPMPADDLEEKLDGIREKASRATGEPCEELYVSDYSGIPFGMRYGGIFAETTPPEQLNVLAAMMRDSTWECGVVESAIATGYDGPEDLLGLCNWIESADEIPYYSYDLPYGTNCSLEPEEKYALQCLGQTGALETLDKMGISEDYLDLEAIGRDWGDRCYLGDDGYIDATQDMPEENYYSWEDLEYHLP